jgi:hypothetical protein
VQADDDTARLHPGQEVVKMPGRVLGLEHHDDDRALVLLRDIRPEAQRQ